MKQMELPFAKALRVGDKVRIVSKSCGSTRGIYHPKKGVIKGIGIYPNGWQPSCEERLPSIGETYYKVIGNYYLKQDLKLIRG